MRPIVVQIDGVRPGERPRISDAGSAAGEPMVYYDQADSTAQLLDWYKKPFPTRGYYEWLRQKAEELKQQSKPPPPKKPCGPPIPWNGLLEGSVAETSGSPALARSSVANDRPGIARAKPPGVRDRRICGIPVRVCWRIADKADRSSPRCALIDQSLERVEDFALLPGSGTGGGRVAALQPRQPDNGTTYDREGPMVCRLAPGGKRIGTAGPTCDAGDFHNIFLIFATPTASRAPSGSMGRKSHAQL
jgi:hypothetical protein